MAAIARSVAGMDHLGTQIGEPAPSLVAGEEDFDVGLPPGVLESHEPAPRLRLRRASCRQSRRTMVPWRPPSHRTC